ncbi:hypothetical protein [Kitasatospora azatica]|uniref:hypothetical protein n=1 Tax=Kitasatospora azatica TaxID=58347 RepID=UPI000569D254|nr:hypothetical protein [Kitasatospora azatica]
MGIPGFQAEAAVYRSTGAYATVAPAQAGGTAGRIAPMLSDLQIMCDRDYDGCEEECAVLLDNYDAWKPCGDGCLQNWRICMNPDPDPGTDTTRY